jgi:peptidoglycan/LPS O-acetylase OafA/YrhL
MDSRCEAYGTDESLWSLGYEFWFYALFGAGAVAVVAALRGRFTTAVLAGSAAIVCVLI